jgi:hypothetical protein
MYYEIIINTALVTKKLVLIELIKKLYEVNYATTLFPYSKSIPIVINKHNLWFPLSRVQ